MKIDDNLEISVNGAVICSHCHAQVGPSPQDPLRDAIRRERPSREGEPGIHADPARFTDRPIVIRQFACPSCYTVLKTEVVPDDEPEFRLWKLVGA